METRRVVLVVVLVFVAGLGGLTIDVAVRQGVDVLVVASLLVLALFGFGVVGALRHPPDE
jgi:hypothetical protein